MPSSSALALSALLLLLSPLPSSAGASVFGLGAALDTSAASVSLICIVLFTIGFEVGTHNLNHALEDSVYKEMVAKIYTGEYHHQRSSYVGCPPTPNPNPHPLPSPTPTPLFFCAELTILGVISFMVFIFLQSPGKAAVEEAGYYHYILAFEFAHIVIFFSALVFVMEACYMMRVNTNLKQKVDQISAISSEDMLKTYEENKSGSMTADTFLGRFLPSKLCTTLEFKVLQIFFCEQYVRHPNRAKVWELRAEGFTGYGRGETPPLAAFRRRELRASRAKRAQKKGLGRQ